MFCVRMICYMSDVYTLWLFVNVFMYPEAHCTDYVLINLAFPDFYLCFM